VVISSNRSEWIESGIAAADAQLASLNLQTISNVSDLRHFPRISVKRFLRQFTALRGSAPIPIAMFILSFISSEYAKYKKALLGAGMTAVGWGVKRINKIGLTGFGASRFAAIEFCKVLRSAATVGGRAPLDYAWLFDDNVVALSSFAGRVRLSWRSRTGPAWNTPNTSDNQNSGALLGHRDL
jgi:hypothetical protein